MRIEAGEQALPDASAQQTAPSGAGAFLERVGEIFASSDALQRDAEGEAEALASGSGRTVETMLALSKADLSLRLVVAMRDRALGAYEEIMRMQV